MQLVVFNHLSRKPSNLSFFLKYIGLGRYSPRRVMEEVEENVRGRETPKEKSSC